MTRSPSLPAMRSPVSLSSAAAEAVKRPVSRPSANDARAACLERAKNNLFWRITKISLDDGGSKYNSAFFARNFPLTLHKKGHVPQSDLLAAPVNCTPLKTRSRGPNLLDHWNRPLVHTL